MSVPRAEKAYEKHGWKLLLAGTIVSLLISLLVTFAPGQVCETCRGSPEGQMLLGFIGALGSFFVGTNVLGIAITLKSFRRGEKWAWYVMLYYPIVFGIHSIFIQIPPHNIIIAVLSLLGLLLPYRKFFPRK